MRAEIISIGDEMTFGQRLDTNSQWLSQQLGDLGVPVAFHTTVGDNLSDNVLVLKQACERADLVICSGGLGPTADDLTRQAVADMLGVELVQDDAALAHIEALFARRKRPMPASNRLQALFPRGSRVVPNPHGSAPGIDALVPRPGRSPARLFCLPGVPAEMKEMWSGTLAREIPAHFGIQQVFRHYEIKCFGVGESDLEAMLPDLIRRGREPSVGITVSQATITLRISAAAPTAEQALAAMQSTITEIQNCLGDLIYGYGDVELSEVVLNLLAERGQSLSVVEWGTSGLLSLWLSQAAGNQAFRGGLIVRDRASLGELGASDALAASDPELVRALAQAARRKFQTEHAIVVGAFPTPEAAGYKTAGEVALGVAGPDFLASQSYMLAGHPEIVRPRTAKQALNLLRLKMLGK